MAVSFFGRQEASQTNAYDVVSDIDVYGPKCLLCSVLMLSSQGDCLRQLKLGFHAQCKGIEACARKVHCRKAGQMQCFSGTLLMVGRLSHPPPRGPGAEGSATLFDLTNLEQHLECPQTL